MITTKMQDKVKELNSRFKYVSDKEQYGVKDLWRVMPLGKVMEGDCEDYSVTLLRALVGNSYFAILWALLKREAKFHFVRVPQTDGSMAGHCVLEYNGKFIDNIWRTWVDKSKMTNMGYDFRFKFYLPILAVQWVKAKVVLTIKAIISKFD